MKLKVFISITLACLLVLSYQNCAETEFSGIRFSQISKSETFVKSLGVSGADILFVVDDSISMGIILDNIRNGVDSMNAVNYPANTRLAVTYMSPAKINSDGSLDKSRSHNNYAVETPGFLKLVTAETIGVYDASSSSAIFPSDPAKALIYEAGKAEVSDNACSMAWFDPVRDTNTNGESCFSHATLTPLLPTGVEAGLSSLKQLSEVYTNRGELLFRPNASVFIVFVSDTHDPGAGSYYGGTGNPASMPTYEELRASILANNPNIDSIKFSGIVPVPARGNPLLQGLNVLGPVPDVEEFDPANPDFLVSRIYKNADGSGGEGLHDFSYVEVIKRSQGVIAHPTSDDWSDVMNDLLAQVNVVSEVRLQLKSPINELLSVKMNGLVLDPSQYFIESDNMSIVIQADFDLSINYTFTVDYL